MKRVAMGLTLFGAVLIGQAPTVGQSRTPFTLALTGDSIIMQRLSPFAEPEFTGLINLVRGADAAFTNLETLFRR